MCLGWVWVSGLVAYSRPHKYVGQRQGNRFEEGCRGVFVPRWMAILDSTGSVGQNVTALSALQVVGQHGSEEANNVATTVLILLVVRGVCLVLGVRIRGTGCFVEVYYTY